MYDEPACSPNMIASAQPSFVRATAATEWATCARPPLRSRYFSIGTQVSSDASATTAHATIAPRQPPVACASGTVTELESVTPIEMASE